MSIHQRWLFALATIFPLATGIVGCADVDTEDDTEGTPDDLSDDVSSTSSAATASLLDTEEAAFLTLINNYRAGLGLGKLRVSIALTRASKAHSVDMATHGCFQHNSCDGTETFVRIAKYYNYNTYKAENIAAGTSTAQQAFNAWKASAPHDANMRSATFTVLGIGRATDANGKTLWTTDFGGYTDAILSTGFGTIASNGGFESTSITTGVTFSSVRTLSRWHTYAASGGNVARSTSTFASGAAGLLVKNPDPGAASGTQIVRAQPGIAYGVSTKAKWSSGSAAVVYLDFLDANFARISVKTVSAGVSTTWTNIATSAVSPAGTKYVRVILYGSGSAGNAGTSYFDDVRVTAE